MKESLGCMYCPFICSSPEKQVAHYLEMHANKNKTMFDKDKYICIVCGNTFRTNDGLKHHSEKEHQTSLKMP